MQCGGLDAVQGTSERRMDERRQAAGTGGHLEREPPQGAAGTVDVVNERGRRMKIPQYVVVRMKDMEVICFTGDIGAALDFVADQTKNEDAEYVIYEKLGRDDTPVRY